MSSHPAAQRTVAMVKTRTACSTITRFQVVLKPAPEDILDLYLGSLAALGLDLKQNDVRFVEDDWENPTLGAWGLAWEVWLNGMEVTQFTYFQQVGGIDCKPILGEITYGLERLAMYLQGVENVYDLVWTEWTDRGVKKYLTYGDVYHQNEVEQSAFNFEQANVPFLFTLFGNYETEAKRLIEEKLTLPAYENILKAAHTFNLLGRPRRLVRHGTGRLYRSYSHLVTHGRASLLRIP